MKKLSFFLMAMLFTCATTLQAAEVTETIAMKGFGGLTTASYENVTKTGTSDKGTEMVAYAFNPSTGQIRGNKTAIAGASVTSADKNKNWSLYNTQAMPGAIKKITVTQTATGTNMFKGNLYVALGTTDQGAVTSVTGAQKNTTGTATEFTFDIDETQGYTYFKLLSNVVFTGGSVAGAVVTVTYVTAEGGEEEVTKYTVTANVNDPAMGTVSGAGEYAEGKTATLTANANPGYKFVNWSNGSTENPLKITVTEDVEITANFEVIPTMTCTEASAAASGATVVLNPFDVVYVVKGAGYIYIKDESGVALIYDFNLDDQLKAGDHVEGFIGVSSPYNGLPEIKPTVSFADLKVTPGTAPEVTVFETVPTKEDVNKYVVFKGVKLTSNISYTTSSATNATISVGGKNVTLRNQFKLAASLTSGSTYDIYAFVAVYNGNIQMYYASSVDVSPERTITATVNPAETGTVTGAGTYKEGKTATLKATPAEGYAFTCWTEGEDTVSTAANYSFKVAADRALVANFAQKTYNVTVTAENGTVTGAGEYIENAEVTLEATPAEGYEFTCWTSGEDTVSTENPYTFAVTANVALVANFKEVVVEEPVEAKLYLTPNANWLKDNARFAAYFYGNGETWVSMTKVAGETNLYEVTTPTDKKYPNVIFCRMNPSAAANNWTNKWNQTDDLTIPTDGKNHYTVKENTWDKGGGTWSIWPLPVVRTYVDVTITVTANAPASIKWANAGDKLADATDYVAMTAGENNTYTYTLAQVDEATGVDYTIKVGELVSVAQNTSKNVTVDFKALLPQVAVQGVNNWDGTDKMTIADDYLTASITLPLVAKKYDLKLTVDGAWKGTTSNNITRENNSSAFTGDSGNGSITADVEGDYVFTYTYATKTLTVTYPELVTTITATFDLTQAEDTRNQLGTYVISAGDYTLRIYGYNGAGTYQDDPTTEEDAAPILFTPDYEDPLDAVVVVTIDEENNKEVMQVTATSADGKKIYNLTINIALPSYETFNYAAIGVTAVPETEEGFTTYALEGEFDNEGTPLPFELYATTEPASVMGTIGEEFVLGEGENVAFFIEADNSFFLMAKLQDEQGNIYNIEMMGTVAASQDVEIVVAKEENITLYNLNLNVQGNMAMVSAGNDALSFWLTLLPSENYYGGYMNDAFSNIWYGDDQLYAAYGDMHLYGDNNGQVMFVVSFITTPDAEGNVTKYNFTLYPGDQPVDSKHTVTITVYPEGAGTVTGAGEYEDGAEVTVTAEANEGYIFLGWMEDGEFVANDSKYTFTILNDVDLVAVYATQLFGVAEDLVITETALTATAILSTGTKLTVNLVLGEYDEEEKGYWLAETTTLTLGDKELTFLEGLVMVDTEQQTAMAAVLAENEGVIYAFTLVLKAPASGVDNINTNVAPRKVIRDGQLIIIKNGVEYNVQGAQL